MIFVRYNTSMNATYQIKGTTDTVCTCDCCGRTDLKCTVILSLDGAVSYFGRTCAARAAGLPAKTIDSAAKSADRVAAEAKRAEAFRASEVQTARFHVFLAIRSSRPSVALQIEELGGFRKAQELFCQ